MISGDLLYLSLLQITCCYYYTYLLAEFLPFIIYSSICSFILYHRERVESSRRSYRNRVARIAEIWGPLGKQDLCPNFALTAAKFLFSNSGNFRAKAIPPKPRACPKRPFGQ